MLSFQDTFLVSSLTHPAQVVWRALRGWGAWAQFSPPRRRAGRGISGPCSASCPSFHAATPASPTVGAGKLGEVRCSEVGESGVQLSDSGTVSLPALSLKTHLQSGGEGPLSSTDILRSCEGPAPGRGPQAGPGVLSLHPQQQLMWSLPPGLAPAD